MGFANIYALPHLWGYDSAMARRSYPNDWARLIAEIVSRPGWSQAKLARTAGVGKNTPGRWISGETANVTTQSIRLIAAAAEIDYDVAARAAVGAQEQLRAEDDEAVRLIMEDKRADDDTKAELIRWVRTRRGESEENLMRDLQFRLGHTTG